VGGVDQACTGAGDRTLGFELKEHPFRLASCPRCFDRGKEIIHTAAQREIP
jgi:hypothetical protein